MIDACNVEIIPSGKWRLVDLSWCHTLISSGDNCLLTCGPLADQIEVLNTHRRVIRKVLRHFGRKSTRNMKMGGEMINLGGYA